MFLLEDLMQPLTRPVSSDGVVNQISADQQGLRNLPVPVPATAHRFESFWIAP
jgi:hypothetical protein